MNHVKNAAKAYETSGQQAVYDYGNTHNLPWLTCAVCDTETPHHAGECLVCGTFKKEATKTTRQQAEAYGQGGARDMCVRCNACEWRGYEEDLSLISQSTPDGPENFEHFKGCPNCKTDEEE